MTRPRYKGSQADKKVYFTVNRANVKDCHRPVELTLLGRHLPQAHGARQLLPRARQHGNRRRPHQYHDAVLLQISGAASSPSLTHSRRSIPCNRMFAHLRLRPTTLWSHQMDILTGGSGLFWPSHKSLLIWLLGQQTSTRGTGTHTCKQAKSWER